MGISKKIIIAGILLILASCGGNEGEELTIEEKKQQLETYKKDFADLQSKIEALEAEISQVENIDPKADLKRVETLRLARQVFRHFIEVPGAVRSNKNVMVTPEMSGVILKKYVEDGQKVTAGQVLLEIDAEVIRKTISELETRLELAKTLYERQANLWEQKIGSEVQYLQAKNEKESLERSLETQREQLGKAFVRSPITGTIDEFFVNAGEMAAPSVPIARVVNLQTIEINAEVSENYLRYVHEKDTVEVTFSSIGVNKKLPIRTVGQFINPQNRTFRIEMQAKNESGLLKPNILAIVRINDFEKKDAIVVPSNIIQKSTNGESFLYKVTSKGDSDVVEKVNVVPGKSYDGKTVIEEGLSEGDGVIVTGYSDVIDGEEVNVVNEKKFFTNLQ